MASGRGALKLLRWQVAWERYDGGIGGRALHTLTLTFAASAQFQDWNTHVLTSTAITTKSRNMAGIVAMRVLSLENQLA